MAAEQKHASDDESDGREGGVGITPPDDHESDEVIRPTRASQEATRHFGVMMREAELNAATCAVIQHEAEVEAPQTEAEEADVDPLAIKAVKEIHGKYRDKALMERCAGDGTVAALALQLLQPQGQHAALRVAAPQRGPSPPPEKAPPRPRVVNSGSCRGGSPP